MAIATEGIIDSEFFELLKSWIAGDRYVDYYIERRNTGINIPIEADDSDRIKSQYEWIDSITGLRFRETGDPNNADIFFTQVDAQFFDNPLDEGTLGYTELVTNGSRNYFDVVYVNDEINDFATQVDGVTINHEIGHTLGLAHPYGDGFNPNFTTNDTIMSYNPVPSSIIKYQDSDIAALRYLWGEAGTNYDLTASNPTGGSTAPAGGRPGQNNYWYLGLYPGFSDRLLSANGTPNGRDYFVLPPNKNAKIRINRFSRPDGDKIVLGEGGYGPGSELWRGMSVSSSTAIRVKHSKGESRKKGSKPRATGIEIQIYDTKPDRQDIYVATPGVKSFEYAASIYESPLLRSSDFALSEAVL